jgi:hypothetical protein
MTTDDEIKAMGTIAGALEALDDGARLRALRWAMSRYGGLQALGKASQELSGQTEGNTDAGTNSQPFASFADLFNASSPKTEKDKALVAAYWMQVCQNVGSFPSQALNTLLKDLGHGIGNITEALTQLKHDRPALVLQLKKSGSSRQARKTYKLTLEGAKRIQMMTQGSSYVDPAP